MTESLLDFREFPKIARLSREIIVTEKIDGTNAQIAITPGTLITAPWAVAQHFDEATQTDMVMLVGSRTRWITPSDDNHGFARWASEHATDLWSLGLGRHFGEWWGSGIQRGYGLPKGEKRLSLFNVSRWCLHGHTPQRIPTADPRIEKFQDVLPACVGLVPVLYRGPFDIEEVDNVLLRLECGGSVASPGFMNPEGVVVFHTASGNCFKKTIKNDDTPKSKIA